MGIQPAGEQRVTQQKMLSRATAEQLYPLGSALQQRITQE